MKKQCIFTTLMLLAAMLASCGNSENPVEPHGRPVVDYGPVEFYVMIKNADGVDLLDSTKHETFLKDIKTFLSDTMIKRIDSQFGQSQRTHDLMSQRSRVLSFIDIIAIRLSP